MDTNYAVNSIERHRRGTSRDPGRSPKRPESVSFHSTARTFRFGAGAQNADFFIPSDACTCRKSNPNIVMV